MMYNYIIMPKYSIFIIVLIAILVVIFLMTNNVASYIKKSIIPSGFSNKNFITRLPSKFIDVLVTPDYTYNFTWNLLTNQVSYNNFVPKTYQINIELPTSSTSIPTVTIKNITGNNIISSVVDKQFNLIYRDTDFTSSETIYNKVGQVILTTSSNLSGSYIQVFDTSITPNQLISQSDIIIGGSDRNIITWSLSSNTLSYSNINNLSSTPLKNAYLTNSTNAGGCQNGYFLSSFNSNSYWWGGNNNARGITDFYNVRCFNGTSFYNINTVNSGIFNSTLKDSTFGSTNPTYGYNKVIVQYKTIYNTQRDDGDMNVWVYYLPNQIAFRRSIGNEIYDVINVGNAEFTNTVVSYGVGSISTDGADVFDCGNGLLSGITYGLIDYTETYRKDYYNNTYTIRTWYYKYKFTCSSLTLA